MTTATTRTFKSGNSQAVRLPKEVAYDHDVELTVVRSGDVITLYPKRQPREEMFRLLRELPGPPEVEVRDPDFFPERPGL